MMKKWTNWLLVIGVVLLAVIPLLLVKNSEFGGADGVAEEAISEVAPNYTPWFAPLAQPPGGETESLLFAVQAALGAGVVGYGIGFYRGRSEQKKKGERDAA